MTKSYGGRERREYPRCDEKMSLLYKPPKSEEIKSSPTRNISGGGVCFETEAQVSPGDVLEIQINKPIDGGLGAILPIHADARVAWIEQVKSGKYKLGLQFVNIDERYRKEIIRNVESKLAKEKNTE